MLVFALSMSSAGVNISGQSSMPTGKATLGNESPVTRKADQVSAAEMLTNAGFRACVTERQKNDYKQHNAEQANGEARSRVIALSRLLIED
jgi:hypothetical protein